MRVVGITKLGVVGLVLGIAAVCGGCSHPATSAAEPKPEVKTVDLVPQRRDADDTARFLAGMPGKPGSPFGDLESTDAWKENRRLLDQAWSGAETSLIAGLGDFQKQELAAAPILTAPVFYPFGGPDALTPLLCFPRSPKYVMVALEPPGTLPSLKQIEKKNLGEYLPVLRNTMASVLGRSFFVTR